MEGNSDGWDRARIAVRAYAQCLRENRPFEAHEALEAAWRESGGPLVGDPLAQGLIQLAAAYVHRDRRHPDGARILYRRVCRRLDLAANGPVWAITVANWRDLGVDLETLRQGMGRWPGDPARWPDPQDIPGVSGPVPLRGPGWRKTRVP